MERSGRDGKQMVKFCEYLEKYRLASIDLRKMHLKVNISALLSYNNNKVKAYNKT